MDLQNNLRTATEWEIIEKTFDPNQLVTTGSNFMIGNGYLGYRGTFEEWEAKDYVACIVTDTWDKAEGSQWSELCNVPNGLFTQLFVNEELVTACKGTISNYYRALDLRHGLNQRKMHWRSPEGSAVQLEIEKFASKANHHLLIMQYGFTAQQDGHYHLTTGINGEVWSIQGEHFRSYSPSEEDGLLILSLRTHEQDTPIAVVEGVAFLEQLPDTSTIKTTDKSCFRELRFTLKKGETVRFQKVVAITHANEVEHPLKKAKEEVIQGLQLGYAKLKREHQKVWDLFWERSDIEITGNPEAQVVTRFNIYHSYIATPTHANLPIGARGLSCQVYQGAAFWDQETYNLPMYCYTHPEIARNLVGYRFDTLSGAKRKAKKLGYYGAFYAWTSGKTGDELFPDYFFTDVLTGRKIRNHFNCWQIHISPDVVYGIWLYFEASSDWDFMLNHGAEVLFEVAQFIVSRVHFKKDKNRFELIRVLGPDEYHENVDNNAYTNYLTKYALEKAIWVFDTMKTTDAVRLTEVLEIIGIGFEDREDWNEIAESIYLPQPDPKTGVIEQFDGYFSLEDIRPDALRKRLIDPGEYWGWPNGIAVNTQVLKQADIIQLLALLDGFSNKVLTANYEYYEPRTEHGSSLSPSVHALVACKANHHEEAYRYFIEASTIDIYNASKKVMSGGSFLGGIHTAAAGGVWRIIVEGFAGFKIANNGIAFDPALPYRWGSISFKLVVKECLLAIKINKDTLHIKSDERNTTPITISFRETTKSLAPGYALDF
ncbi:MAG: glycosyl hydrolase family 65 protein [Bacteroidota bacterium]